MVTALLAAGFTLYLTGRDTSSTFDAVATVADELREQGVTGQSLDRETANRMASVMDGLLDFPDTIGDHADDLRVMAETAASWAAAADSASRDLHIAVSLRSAAGDLRAYALRPSQVNLARARRHLDQALSSLEGGATEDGANPPSMATDGLRDRIDTALAELDVDGHRLVGRQVELLAPRAAIRLFDDDCVLSPGGLVVKHRP